MRILAARRAISLVSLAFLSMVFAAAAHAQPGFSKVFFPNSIGPGSTSELVFTITNGSGAVVTDLAFTDSLPAGMTIANGSAQTDCTGATLTAAGGAGTITLSDGQVSAFGSCTISVDVTSATVGTAMNVTSPLSSSAGESMAATADLTITGESPGFSKSFSPASVRFGERSTLTFTIDNTLNTRTAFSLTFTDPLPPGIALADPVNAATTCMGGVVTAAPGGSLITYAPAFPGDASVAMGAICTISVDVVGTAVGSHLNRTSPLTGFTLLTFTSGFATDTLTVTRDALALNKSFTDDPALPGSTVTLEFTILNGSRDSSATNITFTDDLDATLSGLVATGLPLADPCGPGSSLTGTSLLTLTGGNLGPGASCTFSVTLQVPAAAPAGGYPNTTSTITADVGGSPVVGSAATEILFVNEAPSITKTFLTDPVGAGETTTLEFTITNNSTTSAATDITFQDNLSAFLSGAAPSSLPPTPCGAGSVLFTTFLGGDLVLQLVGGQLAASASCTFGVDLTIPAGTPPGTYPNSTSAISATVDTTTQVGGSATGTLTVAGAPRLTKDFTDDPVNPGDTVTLEFTLENPVDAIADATGIGFTDDLTATLAGLAAVGLPQNDICGTGSSLSGTTNLTFAGGILAPGASCTFSVTLQVPAGALPGSYLNATSNVSATSSGLAVTGSGAADTLEILGLTFTKEFIDDPVIPGDLTTLRFTITNTSPTQDATGILFTDSLSTTLTGLTTEGALPTDPCGTGSVVAGTTFLIFTGGTLTAGSSCSFDVSLRVPGGAAPGSYGNLTSSLTATVGGATAIISPASDNLVVSGTQLLLEKSFTDDPASPGGTVTLEFTLTNLDPLRAASGISFTDDLDAALSGLTATALPAAGFCGAGSTILGTGLLTVTGASLPAGGSCTFSTTLMVPAGVSLGTTATNVTSSVTGTIAGLAVTGDPATDILRIDFLSFSKAFDGPTVATGTPTLTFTITNNSATDAVAGLGFTDDLDAVLTGMVATGLPLMDVCGAGSVISGTSLLTLSGASLAPGGSCSIMVPLLVPAGATAGTYPNTTSDLLQSGLPAAAPATADLVIEPPPTFAKAFAPAFIGLNQVSTLTFTIDNTATGLSATGLAFTDTLPAGMVVAATPNASTTCTGGVVTATAGSGSISLSGGTVGGGAVCTVQADVTATAVGSLVNTTGDLTSSSGNSGTATDTLVVNPQKGFSKEFSPNPVVAGAVSTLTFTIDNSGSTVAATALDFTDNLPAGMVVATPANASTTCTGGTLTAVSGSGVITYTGGTVAAGASCTVQADVTSLTPGDNVNVSGNLTSSLGTGGVASDTLTVTLIPPTFAKVFAPDSIGLNQVSTLTFTIDNTVSAVAATSLTFNDNLPAGMVVASPSNAATTCGGTVTAGVGLISLAGGTVAAGATCTVSVDVTATATGSLVNLSGDLTSSSGNSGTATDTLVVNPQKGFSKEFSPNPINVGDVTTLTFTIDNGGSTVAATGLDFTDVMPSGMTVATPSNAMTTCTGGTITAVSGTDTIAYTGGSVAAGATCTVQVDVTALTFGDNVNVSGNLTSSLGVGGVATDTLVANLQALTFDKDFAPSIIGAGGVSTLTFTIDNPSNPVAVDNLSFTDNLPAGMTVASPANVSNGCTGGTVTASSGSGTISYSGGSVPATASCSISVDVTSSTDGVSTNTSSALTSDAGSTAPATASLTVIAPPTLTKTFIANPVLRGGLVTVEYTVTHNSATLPLNDIAFTDDLGAALPGLAAVDLPLADVCGAGSTFTGTTTLTLAAGNLPPGGSCTFSATLEVPADAALGIYTSTTGMVTGNVPAGSPRGARGDIPVIGGTASADLEVVFFTFEKVFADGPVQAGTTTVLTFTLSNPDPNNEATGVTFVDDLDAVIPGMAAEGLPLNDACGAGSAVVGISVISLVDGILPAGGSCTFDVTVRVPAGATNGTYTNVTTPIDAVVNGNDVSGDAGDVASADLEVVGNPIAIPTLGTWGFLLLAGLLGLLAVRRLRPGI